MTTNPDPPPPTDVQDLQTSPREAALKEVQAALKGVGPPLGLDVAKRRIERAQDIIAEALAAAPSEPSCEMPDICQEYGCLRDPLCGEPPGRTGEREAVKNAVHAWIREDLDVGTKIRIGYYGPKLIDRLLAALSGSGVPAGAGEPPENQRHDDSSTESS